MNHGVADQSQKPEFPTLYSRHPRANIAREWGTHSLEVRDKIHNGKEDGPPPPRCQATPLRSVREMCLLLTAPYIEPALAAIMLRRADSSTQSSAPVLWQRRSSFHHIELLLTQAVGPLRAN